MAASRRSSSRVLTPLRNLCLHHSVSHVIVPKPVEWRMTAHGWGHASVGELTYQRV